MLCNVVFRVITPSAQPLPLSCAPLRRQTTQYVNLCSSVLKNIVTCNFTTIEGTTRRSKFYKHQSFCLVYFSSLKLKERLSLSRKRGTYADFERLDGVVQQQYVAHNLCVLPVSLQLRRPDIVGSASRQAEARAHHAPTRV